MKALEPNMYVRTKWGIAKIIDYEAQKFLIKLDKKIMYENLPEYYDYITIADILKASHNIIDLIQVGDYVNGFYVEDVKETFVNVATGSDYFQSPTIYEEQIKSILTREQFESMKYEVK